MASGNRENILAAQPIKKNEKGLEVLRIRCPAGAYWIGDPSTMEDGGSWYDNVCMEETIINQKVYMPRPICFRNVYLL
jgi:hypothetical protein